MAFIRCLPDMRFLADAGISPATTRFLQQSGHDAVHVRDIGMQRESDEAILNCARVEDRIVLTFDLDFGDILALGVHRTLSVIIFRLADERPASVNERLSAVLKERSGELEAGALIVVEDSRYRVRKLPIR